MAIDKTNTTKIGEVFSVLTPSGIGIVIYTTIAGLVVLLHQIKSIEQYLQIPGNFNLGAFIMRWLDTILTSAIGAEKTQSLVVGLFWAFVGLGVYVLLHGIAQFIMDMSSGLDERKFVWPKGANRYRPLAESLERGFFRVIATVALIVVILGPLSQVLSGPVWEDFIGPSLPLQLAVWFVAIWVILHVSVVLVRLIALRPRLFG